MVRAGVMTSPLLPPADNPTSPMNSPLMPPGMGGMGGGSPSLNVALQGLMALGQQAAASFDQTAPAPAARPSYGFNSATNQFFAKGRTFGVDDYQAAVESADQPGTVAPLPQGFQPLSEQQFSGYVQSIRNPSTGTLASRNFGRGIDTMQLMGGRFLQLLGAEETGQRIVNQQEEDLRKTTPYDRRFSDIESGGDAIDYAVATVAQQGPNLLLSFLSGGLGALGGRALAGATTSGVLRDTVMRKVAGKALTQAENKLIRYATAGALAGGTATNYPLIAGELYGEFRDQGAGPDDTRARVLSLLGAIPSTALESAPEMLVVGKLLGRFSTSGNMLRRGVVGAAVGAGAEGLTEAGQESIALGLTGQDFSDPQNITRLIESFAAGATVGGVVGGLVNLRRGKSTDVLQGGTDPDQMLALPPPDNYPALPAPPPPYIPPGGPAALTGPAPQLAIGAEQRLALPDYSEGFVPTEGELELRGGEGSRSPTNYRPAQGEMFPVGELGQAPAMPQGGQMELPFAAGANQRPEIQDVLPLETGLPPRFFADQRTQPPAAGTVGGANPVLAALQRRMQTNPQFDAAERERAAQVAAQEQQAPGMAALRRDLTLQQIQPELLAAETALPEVQTSVSPANAAEAWRRLAGRGRPKAFEKFLPATQNQWIDALNMAVAGELTQDDLKQIRIELVQAETVARITKSEPRTVVTGAITPLEPDPKPPTPPTPPKGNKLRADQKPKPATVARTQPAGRGGQGLKRGTGGTTGQTTGAPVAAATQPAAQSAKPKPVQQPKAKAVRETVVEPTYASAEEAWEDMKPQGAPGLNEKTANNRFVIPAMFRAQWQNIFKSGKASIERAKQVYDRFGSELNALFQVRQAIALMEEDTRSVSDDFLEAADTLVEFAFFTTEETNTKDAVVAARAAMVPTDFAPKQWKAILDAFVSQANEKKQRQATYVQGENKGDPQPWINFAFGNNLIKQLKVEATNTDSLPQEIKDALGVKGAKAAPQVTSPTQESKAADPASPLATLVRFMAEYLKRGRLATVWDNEFTFEGNTYSYGPRGFAEDMFAEINPADTAAQFMGVPIREYFNKDGSLRLVEGSRIVSGNNEFVTLKIGTAEDAKSGPTTATVDTTLVKGKRDAKSAAPTETVDNRTLKPSDTGKFSLSSFNNPETSMSEGSVRLAVGKFLSKLMTKPKVTVVRNQADLMRRYPALYRKAVAERPQGDFDAAQAAGYSFAGGNVIIFTDRIANEQHLNFVLAHETMGHFGLRGIIPESKFNAVMDQVYQSSPHVQADVDAYVAQGMSKEEAVEEYLSDFAGILDTSVVARIWNAIKNALNKLGVKFGDEMVRHLLKQSRSYVRQGKSYIHQTDQVFTDMYLIENGYGPQGTGRFSSVGDLHGAQQTIVNSRFAGWQAPSDMAAAWQRFVQEVGPTANKLDRFVGQFLSLSVFRARKNPGAQRLYEILQRTNGIATRVRVKSNERNRAIFNASRKVKDQVSGLMYAAQSLAESRITDIRKLNGPPLFSLVDGVLKENKKETKRLKEAGRVTFLQAKKGFEYPVTLADGSTRMEKFAGIENLTEDSAEWLGYLSLRESMDDVALDLLRARYSASLDDRKISFKHFDELVEGKLTDAEKQFIDSMLNTYRDLYAAGTTQDADGNTVFDRAAMQKADDFLVAINQSILNLKEGYAAIEAQFKDQVPDDTVAKLRALSKRIKLNEDKFVVQTRMKQLMIDSLSTKDADLYTRRSLAIGYTPLLREGAYQLRIQAINPRTGQPAKLDEASRNKLVYMQMESESQVVRLADELNTLLSENGKPKRYTLKAYNADTQQFENSEVILVAKAERALDAVTGPPGFNLNEIQYGLRQLNINLTPAEVENVVVAMTRQNAAARNRLQRSNTPGAERDAIKAISKHIDSRASTISKTEMRPQLNELMNLSMRSTKLLWEGDPDLLKELKKQADKSGTTTDRRNYIRYKNMYDTTNPKGGAERGNEFYNEASRTVQFLENNSDVSTSDFESGATVARLRSFASAVQLGGTIAQMVMNFVGVYTNGIPFLATVNERTGFGGGFGAGAAITEYHRALGQVGTLGITNPKANTAEFYADMSDTDLTKYGLTRNEANFIAREIREGRMIPAQSNALLNTSRGFTDSPFLRRFTEIWMAPFNTSEQAARRGLGLAAFRLEFARQKADGVADQKAYEEASRFAAETLDVTMGEYSVLNRPPAWRGGIQTILYMYKVYPTTTIQLLANMSRSGQIAMLFMLLMFAGLQGLPFAEDLEDIVDTIAQALGLSMGSIRAEGAKMLDSALPGASVPLMQGVLNMILPIDIGAKLGMGNLFPGTGIGLAGADVTRELQDIAGPMPAAMLQSAKTIYNVLRLPFSDQVRLPDVLRETPVTMLRALGDTMAYAETGLVVDKRGYTIAGDASFSAFAARITGFQPPDTGRQYGGIRIARRITDYQLDVVTSYRTAWVRAKMAGDDDAARSVEKAVQSWNEGAEGTGLRIRNFMQGSQRALREAKRPAGERALRTTPIANRSDIEQVYDLMGAT